MRFVCEIVKHDLNSPQLKGSDYSEFSYLPCIKCVFLTDIHNKIITCYTYSVRPTIPESKNIKVGMKKIDEVENKDFL